MMKREKIVRTIYTPEEYESYLNEDLTEHFEHNGWRANRRVRKLDTFVDDGKFIVVYDQYTDEWLAAAIGNYIEARSILAHFFNDGGLEAAEAAHNAHQDELERQAREAWNSRSIFKRINDFMYAIDFGFYRAPYRVPLSVDHAIDVTLWYKSTFELEEVS